MPAAPSLLIVPYRSKTGKLYSQIPTSGAGDFTVTRNTEARRFTSAGLIASVASGIPRLDYYTSGGTAGCPALLVEPSGTNLAFPSEDFATSWNAVSSTVTVNQIASPDGLTTADRISITSNNGYVRRLLATSNSTTYTASCFVKNDTITGSDTFRFFFNNNLDAPNAAVANVVINIVSGTVTTTSSGGGISNVSVGIENYGNGWYRVRLIFTLGASAGNANSEIGFNTATATRTFFAWGAQLETGTVATSYIPTTAASGSRSADVISVSGAVSGSIGQTEGTIYVEGVITNYADAAASFITISDNTINNRLEIRKGSSGSISFERESATQSASTSINATGQVNGIFKMAVAYKSGDTAFFINGVQVATTNADTFTMNTLTHIYLGSNASGTARRLNDRIRAAALYTTRLTNAELATLTTL